MVVSKYKVYNTKQISVPCSCMTLVTEKKSREKNLRSRGYRADFERTKASDESLAKSVIPRRSYVYHAYEKCSLR